MSDDGSKKFIAVNRKALHNYDILERVEAGLVLTGTEIKSIRSGRANVRDAYARPGRGELWLVGAHIAQFPQGGIFNHEPMRPRKLLLHSYQLKELIAAVTQKGLTIVPLRLYIRNHVAKLELGLQKAVKGTPYQFLRNGYFCMDLESAPEKLIFNRTAGLRDSWAKNNL